MSSFAMPDSAAKSSEAVTSAAGVLTVLNADLTWQTAIVTGASQGLGRAIARTLAANGAKVACVARNEEKLADTVGSIQELGG